MQDKNPTPLPQLDTLLDETYHRIIDMAEEMEAQQAKLVECAAALSGGVQLLVLLCRFAFRLDDQDYEMLSQVRGCGKQCLGRGLPFTSCTALDVLNTIQ